jgi:hypothetical protein
MTFIPAAVPLRARAIIRQWRGFLAGIVAGTCDVVPEIQDNSVNLLILFC